MAGTAPETPAPIDKILYAQPFTLQDGFAFPTRKEKPQVKTGYLLKVDAASDGVGRRRTASDGVGRRPRREIDTALSEADGQPQAFKDFIELRRHYAKLMKEYLPPEEANWGDPLLMLERVGEK